MAQDTRRDPGKSDAWGSPRWFFSESVPLREKLALKQLCRLGDHLERVGNILRLSPEKRRGFMGWLLVILAVLIFLVDVSLPLGVAGGVPYVAVILTAFWSSRKSLPLLAAVVCTLLVVAGYFLSPAGGELWKVLANRSLAIFAIWTTAALSHLRLRAVELRRESEARVQSILETAPDGILSFDHRGIAQSFNPACERLFGYRPEEVIGKGIDFLRDPHAPGRPNWLRDMLEEAPSSGPREAMEIRGRRHNGDEFPLLISIGEMRLGEGRAFTAILRDITARKRDEQALTAALHEAEQARDKVEALIRSVGDFLIVTDRDLRIVFMNKAAEKMLGMSLNRVSQCPVDRILGGTLSGLRDHLESAVRGPSAEVSEEIPLLFPGQETQGFYQARSARVRGRSAGAGTIVTILRDVTRERTLDRLKSEFVSTAAHELNTPLTSIMGYTELLLLPHEFGEFTPEQKQNFLSEIYARCEDLAHTVSQLLDTARIESGRGIPLEKAPCDLTRRIVRITENFRLSSPMHRFELELPQTSSPLLCLDGGKMDQVLENLLSNAVKYSPDGGRIRVEVRMSEREYRFSVTDEGIGMNPEEQSRIFDKFYRSDTSHTTAPGLGLGLNIAKAIVDGHDGRIEVESEPGKGTTITVSLPVTSC